jgi:hypothetical protein
MPISRATSLWRSTPDHFEPDDEVDPKTQRQLRGQLEQIDYTAYAANKKILGGAIGRVEIQQFEKLALAASVARTQWVAAALAAADKGHALSRDQIEHLAHLRTAYDELSHVYDAMRRMVERGYVGHSGPQTPDA